MPSTFITFEVRVRPEEGDVPELLANTAVHVYDYANGAALPDLATDAQGVVAAAVLDVPPGTKVRFSFYLPSGLCGFDYQTTF
jgi:hypothetical protein